MNKKSSILNNDFYMFILILLLIIILFLLSQKKDNFTVNISKIKYNKREPFMLNNFTNVEDEDKNEIEQNNNIRVKISDDTKSLYLIINRNIVENNYILKNDIIKIYDTENDKDEDKDFYYNVLKVEYDPNNNYKLTVDLLNVNKLNENPTLNRVKVVGNKYKNSILSSSINFKKNTTLEDGNYELVFNNKDKNGNLDIEEINKQMKNFEEEEVIEIDHKSFELDDRLFLIKNINFAKNKIILNNKNENLEIPNTDRILIKKFDLNEIINDYYKEKKEYNVNYLVAKNKIKNLGLLLDNIKNNMKL